MYIQPGQSGMQGGVVLIQPTGAVTTTTHGYPIAGQQPVYIPQQIHVSFDICLVTLSALYLGICHSTTGILDFKLGNLMDIAEYSVASQLT